MKLEYYSKRQMAKLAWGAHCRGEVVRVFHGPCVEVKADWFVEGIWNGPFEKGGFDRTSIVSGSGGRVRGRKMIFVSSGNTLDRLWYWKGSDEFWVSNSLPCILVLAGTQLRDDYRNYSSDIMTIGEGLNNYVEIIPVTNGDLRVVYVDNLVYDREKIQKITKSQDTPDFPDFDTYFKFLRNTTREVAANMSSLSRSFSVSPRIPLSSGYDSSAVAAITKDILNSIAVSLSTAWNPGLGKPPNDSGQAVAEDLGLSIEVRGREERFEDEVACWSCWGRPDDLCLSLLGLDRNAGITVYFTGIYGDKIWDKKLHDLQNLFVRGKIPHGRDMSGACFTDFRLQYGIIQCSIPMWGIQKFSQIQAISQLAEMEPWSLNNNYDRPIPRRICETAGVDREHFGRSKRWVASTYMWAPASRKHRKDFFTYLRRNKYSLFTASLGKYLFILFKFSCAILRRIPILRRHVRLSVLKFSIYPESEPLFRWALDKIVYRFEEAFELDINK